MEGGNEQQTNGKKCRAPKKEVKEEFSDDERYVSKSSKTSKTQGSKKKDTEMKVEDDFGEIEQLIKEGEFGKVKVADLKLFLKAKGLSTTGKKEELIDRVLVFLSK
mgnify:CR=1 FL=1